MKWKLKSIDTFRHWHVNAKIQFVFSFHLYKTGTVGKAEMKFIIGVLGHVLSKNEYAYLVFSNINYTFYSPKKESFLNALALICLS